VAEALTRGHCLSPSAS